MKSKINEAIGNAYNSVITDPKLDFFWNHKDENSMAKLAQAMEKAGAVARVLVQGDKTRVHTISVDIDGKSYKFLIAREINGNYHRI